MIFSVIFRGALGTCGALHRVHICSCCWPMCCGHSWRNEPIAHDTSRHITYSGYHLMDLMKRSIFRLQIYRGNGSSNGKTGMGRFVCSGWALLLCLYMRFDLNLAQRKSFVSVFADFRWDFFSLSLFRSLWLCLIPSMRPYSVDFTALEHSMVIMNDV